MKNIIIFLFLFLIKEGINALEVYYSSVKNVTEQG